MKVGIALNMLSEPGRPDVAVVQDHLAMGDLAEPLGFDSLFALEHHFTGYAMSPAPLQLLAYYAGRTKRIMFGTAVIVLPWHDPIRVAEGIALLDILSGGRCLFGFGRGAASVEYAGFRIPMEEARPRFAEAAQLIRKALREPEFDWQGQFYQIPRTSIRPRPISHPEERFYASSVSPESAEIMAKLGFGILVVMQNEWPKAAESIVNYREIALSVGHNPPPPIILTNISCAESRDEAHDRAMEWLGKKWQSIDNHYHFSDGHLATVKGYETYGKMAKTYARLQSEEERVRATEFYVKIQIVGTPDDCIEQIAELQRVTGTDHVVTEFSFGGIPHEDAEENIRLFASRVLPVLQNDSAFAAPPVPVHARCCEFGPVRASLEASSAGAVLQPPCRGAFQFDGVAVGVADVERGAIALGSVAFPNLADLDAVPLQVGDQGRRVEPLDPYGKVIHVASRTVRRLARRAGRRNQIDQRGAGTQLDQLGLVQAALDTAVQDSFVEIDRAVEIADPQHDMVEAGYADPLPATRSVPSLDISCVRHLSAPFARGRCHSTANGPASAAGLLRHGPGLLRGGMAWVLSAPSTDLGAVEDAVVIGVHLVEAGPGPLRCPILGALDVLIPRDAAIARRSGRCGSRTLDGRNLRRRLSEGCRRQQRQRDDSHKNSRAHLLRLSVD